MHFIQQEGLVYGAEGCNGGSPLDEHADLDLAGGDHLNVDAGRGDGLEHRGGNAGVGAHAQADDRDLGDLGIVGNAAAPISWAAAVAARRVSARSPRAMVKLTSVAPAVATFWTIMSTTMLARAMVSKSRWTTPGRSGTPRMVIRASSFASAAPVTATPSRRASCSPTIQVPGVSANVLRTWIGTPYFLANSIDR